MAKRCTPWEEVRARYETEDCTYRQLAEEYGVSIQSIWTHAQKECWKGRRTRGRDQSIDDRRYLRQVAKALMTAARQAAAQVEDGEVSIKELKEMAGVLQTLTGLEKTLREEEPAAAETVQVVLGDAEEWSRYDGAVPVYGVAVGQDLTCREIDGQRVVEQSNFRAVFTASRLSFWQDATEVAYVSNNRLYITNITVLGAIAVGQWSVEAAEGGLAFRWIGG